MLMAVLRDTPQAPACMAALATRERLLVSAFTLAETLLEASRHRHGRLLSELIEGLGLEVVPVTATLARRAAAICGRAGSSAHPALSDALCLATARERGCALLQVDPPPALAGGRAGER